ncbi:MAG: TonB-dependent receptor, partial [Acidobacteriota bacterium]|nr:TonB-dependent receptor [Acidobacteriota bacterium]
RVNSLRFELSQRRAVERTGEPGTPGVLIPGTVLFGTPFEGNSRRFETHVDGEDTFLFERGHHLFEAGIGVEHVKLRAQVLNGFSGLFVFPTVSALQTGGADFFTRSFGNSTTNFAESRIGVYVQDHWRAAHTLTLDYGLRYEINRLPSTLRTTPLDFSPRLGLAWTPRKSLVVRGGFGIFYDRYLLSTVNRVLEFDGLHASSQIVEGPAAASLYASASIPTASLSGVAPSIWQADSHLINPYSEVGSLSVEQTLPLQTTLAAEYQFVHGVHLGRTVNSNLLPPVLLTTSNAPSLGIDSPSAQQLGRPVFSAARVDPAHDAVNRFSTTASSNFNGATVTLNRQFQDDFELLAGYTYSKTIDDASSDLEQPQNPFDLGAERALSLLDQRHRFTLSGLWLIGPDLGDPADAAANANPGPLMRILNGLEFAPIFQVGSGFRVNPVTGLDSSREHIFPFAARPAGYARNSLSTTPNIDFDLRLLKMVPLGKGHLDISAESFNLLNHRNVSLLNAAFGLNAQPQSGFGTPIATSTPRHLQFSLDYEF